MKENFERWGQILSRTEELVLITRKIDIHTVEDAVLNTDSITGVMDVHKAVHNYITIDITDDVVKKYNLEFTKYNPTFKKVYDCSSCGHNFSYNVDLELALFRNLI